MNPLQSEMGVKTNQISLYTGITADNTTQN